MKKLLATLAAGLAMTIANAPRAHSVDIVDLGSLGGGFSNPTNISADGTTSVGNSSLANGQYRAFRYTSGGGMQDLGVLAGDNKSNGNAVSADGSVVVGQSANLSTLTERGFRWTSGGGMQALTNIAGASGGKAWAVSADGNVIAGMNSISSTRHAVLWNSGVPQDLGAIPGGDYSEAYGISANGQVVVGEGNLSVGSTSYNAFKWTSGGGMQDLGKLAGGTYSLAMRASADGSVIVGYGDATGGSDRAIRWSGANMQSLGVMPTGTWSNAFGVSSDGYVIVGMGDVAAGNRPFIWDAGTNQMTDLQAMLTTLGATGLGSWTSLTMAIGVTKNGSGTYEILGRGVIGGENHAFLVRNLPVPEPSTYALGAIASGVMAYLARRRKARAA